MFKKPMMWLKLKEKSWIIYMMKIKKAQKMIGLIRDYYFVHIYTSENHVGDT